MSQSSDNGGQGVPRNNKKTESIAKYKLQMPRWGKVECNTKDKEYYIVIAELEPIKSAEPNISLEA